MKCFERLVMMHITLLPLHWTPYITHTERPQTVRNSFSSTPNTGAPQGFVLSPLLFTLLTHDCAEMHRSNHIIKFADYTTTVGLISKDDELAYREEVHRLTDWGKVDLSLNVDKMKKMVVDFRRA